MFEELRPGTTTYTETFRATLSGPLDAQALLDAVRTLRDRHGALRTLIALGRSGRPRQVVTQGPFDPGVVDVCNESDVDEIAASWARTPFRLDSEALFDARLLRAAADRHTLLLRTHHLVCDGWSEAIIADELSRAYARAVGDVAELPGAPTVEYADFAERDREAADRACAAGGLAFWREALAGAPSLLRILEGRLPRGRAGDVEVRHEMIPRSLVEPLGLFARDTHCSLYMVLLSVFATALGLLADQRDLVIGTPIAGRDAEELDGVVGQFVNPIPLRLRVSEEHRPLAARLADTRNVLLSALQHGQVPFDRVLDAVRPRRDPGVSPLVQVYFQLHNVGGWDLCLPGVDAEVSQVATGEAKLELSVAMLPSKDGLLGVWEYAPSQIRNSEVEWLRAAFRRGLAAITQGDLSTTELERVMHGG